MRSICYSCCREVPRERVCCWPIRSWQMRSCRRLPGRRVAVARTHTLHTGSSRARTGPAGCRYSPILYNNTPQYVQGARCPCRSLSPATCSTPHPNSPSSYSAPCYTGRTARWRTVGMQQRRCQDNSKRRTNLLTGTLFPPSELVNAGHHCAGSLPAQVGRQRLGHHRRRRVRRYRVSGMFA